jgi:hypothetical protein
MLEIASHVLVTIRFVDWYCVEQCSPSWKRHCSYWAVSQKLWESLLCSSFGSSRRYAPLPPPMYIHFADSVNSVYQTYLSNSRHTSGYYIRDLTHRRPKARPPLTVAARPKAWTVFAVSNAGMLSSNIIRGMNVYVCVYSVCVVLCVGRGLATDWSPVQAALPTGCRIKKLNKRTSPNKRAVEPLMIVIIIIKQEWEHCRHVNDHGILINVIKENTIITSAEVSPLLAPMVMKYVLQDYTYIMWSLCLFIADANMLLHCPLHHVAEAVTRVVHFIYLYIYSAQ